MKTQIEIQPVNLRSFKQKVRHHSKRLKSFLTKLEKNAPKNLDTNSKRQFITIRSEKKVRIIFSTSTSIYN